MVKFVHCFNFGFGFHNRPLLLIFLYMVCWLPSQPSLTSASGTPSSFLSALTLSCPCSSFACFLIHWFTVSLVFTFRAVIWCSFLNEAVTQLCMFLPWAFWIFWLLVLTCIFVLSSLIGCKLHEGRNWVLSLPFQLESSSFSLGTKLLLPLAMVLVEWSTKVSYQQDALLLEFELWVVSYKNWQWLALVEPCWGALKKPLISSCLPDPWSCSDPELFEAWFSRFSFIPVRYLVSLL